MAGKGMVSDIRRDVIAAQFVVLPVHVTVLLTKC